MRAFSQLRRLFTVFGLVLVVALAGGAAIFAGNTAHKEITANLAQEHITFPKAGTEGITALPPADGAVIAQYAGQNLTTGDQAKAYADNFIWVHTMKATNGKTYAQMDKADPARGTALTGDTLRGMLLTAYAWWTAGTYAILAGYVLIGLAIVMFAFKLPAYRRATVTDKAFSASSAYAAV